MTDDTDDSEADIELDSNIRANESFASGLRLGIASELGQTGFNDDENPRNHYDVFGWPRDVIDGWDEDNWLALYLRNAYARIVVEKPTNTTWRDAPEITDPNDDGDGAADGGDDPNDFERAVEKLHTNHRVWSYCERADRAAGIGQHGLLLLGFSDVVGGDGPRGNLDQWSTDAREKDLSALSDIVQLKPVLGAQIEDIDYGDPDSERWDLPVEYTIDLGEDTDSETEDDSHGTIDCHWSRVIDIPSTRPLDDETLARPRIEPVLNNILDIEKILGAAAEAGYRSADYGLHLNADPTEVNVDGGMSELQDELEAYEHDLQRYIRTAGVEVNRLGGDIQDPSGIVENNLDAIAGQTDIPKKEFRGNESGEVSGAEADERSYFGMVAERREQYATPHIVRPLIDRLQAIGILPMPTAGEYRVEWPDLAELSAKDAADIESKRAQVISAVPGLAGDTAMQYLKDGADALPDGEETPSAGELSERELSAQRETFDKVVGNADGPFSDIPVIPTGLEKLSKAWVIRWAEWIAAGRPDVKDVRQRANDWNPALHPRDPRTGQFVERPFNLPDGAPDFGDMDTPEVLSYIDENDDGTLSDTVLNPDSPVTVDGVPDDASSLDDIDAADAPPAGSDIASEAIERSDIEKSDVITVDGDPFLVAQPPNRSGIGRVVSRTGEVFDGHRIPEDADIKRYEADNVFDLPFVDSLSQSEGGLTEVSGGVTDAEAALDNVQKAQVRSDNIQADVSNNRISDSNFERVKSKLSDSLNNSRDPEVRREFARRLSHIGDNVNRANSAAAFSNDDKDMHALNFSRNPPPRTINHEAGHGIAKAFGYAGTTNEASTDMNYFPDINVEQPMEGPALKKGVRYFVGSKDADEGANNHAVGFDDWSDEVEQEFEPSVPDDAFESGERAVGELESGDIVRFESEPFYEVSGRDLEVIGNVDGRFILRDQEGNTIERRSGRVESRAVEAVAPGQTDPTGLSNPSETEFTSDTSIADIEPKPDDGVEEKMERYVSAANRAFHRMHVAKGTDGYDEEEYVIKSEYSSTNAHEVLSQMHEMMQSTNPPENEEYERLVDKQPEVVQRYFDLFEPSEEVAEALPDGVAV